ncbi:MAG: type II secretion system ATPase GspE, partial [Candidatus Omnitrophica bacterium]|nr:type II secretion system ATPase GspE [Candidatus Omnitrophota bacterium]
MSIFNKQDIIKVLREAGNLTEAQIKEALSVERATGERLDRVLTGQGYIEEETVLKSFCQELDIPFQLRIGESRVDEEILSAIPFHFAQKYNIVVIDQADDLLKVAVSDPFNIQIVDDIAWLSKYQVQVIVCPAEEVSRAIVRNYGKEPDSVEKMIENLSDQDQADIPLGQSERVEDLLDLANKAPVIRLVNLILFQAVKDRASDIHIHPYENKLQVRYRIDGVLYDVQSMPRRFQAALISRIKIMCSLNIAEKRLPQDGRATIRVADREIDLRISIVPTSLGERLVMRILDKGNSLFSLEDLGLNPQEKEKLDHLIHFSHGIILVTGPTGSGKTTSLYAALSRINAPDKNIITTEDPIEYQLDGISQIQVNPKIGLTFSSSLRSLLRQDPDILMVGEIRDLDTATVSIQAALTGHLVFSTLHTNDSAGSVTRLLDIGVEPYLVSSSVIGIIAQRLVRVLCPDCKKPYSPDEESLREIGLSLSDIKGKTIYNSQGCEKCFKTGYQGRLGIYEILIIDDQIRELILTHAQSHEIKKKAVSMGMTTLVGDGAR